MFNNSSSHNATMNGIGIGPSEFAIAKEVTSSAISPNKHPSLHLSRKETTDV